MVGEGSAATYAVLMSRKRNRMADQRSSERRVILRHLKGAAARGEERAACCIPCDRRGGRHHQENAGPLGTGTRPWRGRARVRRTENTRYCNRRLLPSRQPGAENRVSTRRAA